MTFADPWLLLALLLIPPLFLLARRHGPPPALPFPDVEGMTELPVTAAVRLARAMLWLRGLLLVLIVLALARPQWSMEVTSTRREGIAIAMVLDVSSSMSAVDLRVADQPTSRLEAVRVAFRDFAMGNGGELKSRDGDLIGMVKFARYADIVAPPTLDHEALIAALERIGIVDFPLEDGTAIGDATLRATEMLRQVESPSRVMILLTDGSNNVGRAAPLVAARIAAALGIKIYTIGAGTHGMAAFPFRTSDGSIEYRMSPVTIDEEALAQLAELTGGRYFRATDAAALRAIYGEIDQLEKTRNLVDQRQIRLELFPLVAGLALLLLLAEILLVNTRLQTVP
jgi:Ca-activated chloride channel homolog